MVTWTEFKKSKVKLFGSYWPWMVEVMVAVRVETRLTTDSFLIQKMNEMIDVLFLSLSFVILGGHRDDHVVSSNSKGGPGPARLISMDD